MESIEEKLTAFLFYMNRSKTMNEEKEFFLTQEGLEDLEAELEELKTVKRKEIAEKIKTAREFGDLSENAEYDQAKNEQAQIEDRINRIEHILRNASIIEHEEVSKEEIGIGASVRLMDKEFNEEVTYTIVGTAEADPKKGRISNVSPVGKQLLGKKVGDSVEVQVGDFTSVYEVLGINE